MADRTFTLKFVGDVADAAKSLKKLETDVDGFKSTTTTAFKAIGAAVSVAAVVGFGKAVVGAASDQEQAIGALNSVFKDYSDNMNEFGQTTAENLGISRAEFSQLAAVTGAMLKNAGVPMDQTAEATKNLTERAADLASMYGGTVPEAMEAMNSAFKGEFDPLEKYAITLKQSAIEAKAVSMGLVDAEGKATSYGKAMATQALIMEQSADSQGNFAKESDSVAGSTQILKAQFEDLQADIGKKLLPIMVEFAKILRGIVTFVDQNQGWLLPLAAGILAVVAGIKAWQLAQAAWTVVTQVATAAQWLWNAALMANPIGLIVIAITAVIAALVLLYMKVDWFREGVDKAIDGIIAAWNVVWDVIKGIFNWVKENWPLLLAILTGPFGLAVKMIVDHWQIIKDFFWRLPGEIRNFLGNIVDIITWPYRVAANAIVAMFDPIKDWFWRFPGLIRGFFGTLADIITYPFRIAFDAIRWLWNSTVGGFNFTVPSWIPGLGGKTFGIPRMAAGGIVTRPTVAMIGEAGAEAVIPLDRFGAMGTTYIVNVYALNANADTGRLIAESLREYNRTAGTLVT